MHTGRFHPGYTGYLPWWEILNEVDAEHSTSVGAVSHDLDRTTMCSLMVALLYSLFRCRTILLDLTPLH